MIDLNIAPVDTKNDLFKYNLVYFVLIDILNAESSTAFFCETDLFRTAHVKVSAGVGDINVLERGFDRSGIVNLYIR
ncbi:hypothetical protein Plhal304r1_c004g0014881 [Plasmopara halstedii]